jgi:hypothetical protein
VGKLHYVVHYIDVRSEPDHEHAAFRNRCNVLIYENGYKSVPARPDLTRIYRADGRAGVVTVVQIADADFPTLAHTP